MKYLLLICFSMVVISGFTQPVDSIRMIEPEREISFGNYDLLIIAIVAFLLLVGLWFWFRRNRKR